MTNLNKNLLVILFLISGSVSAQLKPVIENEWAKSISLGPTLDNNGVKWISTLEIKLNSISKINGYEIEGNKKIFRFTKSEKFQPGILNLTSEYLTKKDYEWIFESGDSSKFFSIELIDNAGNLSKLNIPLNFSYKSKTTLRTFLDKNLKISEKEINIPYYKNLDGRRWYIENSGENDDQILIEMIPSGDKIENWKEIYRINIFKNLNEVNAQDFLNLTKENLSKDCPTLKFNILKQENKYIMYEWSHKGCNSWPANAEITKIALNSENLISYSFAYKNEVIPQNFKDIYIEVLKSAK
ncbi:hypothetical protein P3G55_22090 [Leptospira sp. 96542]|nr:hypothetical protein [Leptospira sp. 96542]